MKNITQQLTFIRNHHTERRGKKRQYVVYALYQCSCGRQCIKRKSDVTRNQIKSCGHENHGMSKSRFYKIWRAVKTRTMNPNYAEYYLYGGRGIKLYDKWTDFNGFKQDMFLKYMDHVITYGESDTQIDRIDSNGNYEPTNCRWVTRRQQSNNRRGVKRYDYNGILMTIPEISSMTGIPKSTLYDRRRYGRDLFNYGDVDSLTENKKGKTVNSTCCSTKLIKEVK